MMVEDHIRNLEKVEEYLRDYAEYRMAANVNHAAWFLREKWQEVIKAYDTRNEKQT